MLGLESLYNRVKGLEEPLLQIKLYVQLELVVVVVLFFLLLPDRVYLVCFVRLRLFGVDLDQSGHRHHNREVLLVGSYKVRVST